MNRLLRRRNNMYAGGTPDDHERGVSEPTLFRDSDSVQEHRGHVHNSTTTTTRDATATST